MQNNQLKCGDYFCFHYNAQMTMTSILTRCGLSLLSVLSKVFEKLVKNRIVDHLEKCDLFSDFQCDFRSS